MGITGTVIIVTIGVILLIMALIVVILIHQRKMLEKDHVINEREIKLQKDLLHASLEIAEQERNKIAANIHDDIGMALHVMKVNISRIKRNIKDDKLVYEVLSDTENLVSNTITITRVLSYDLMPPTLISLGFMEGLDYLVRYIASTKIMEVELRTEKEHVTIEERTKLHLYRLVKEIFNNIIKHTKAKKATINVSFHANIMNIIIEHNGKGITNEAIQRLAESSRGIGLKSIIGRSQLINATVQYVIVDEGKSKVIIEIPI
jgi:two-component system, NarL family, sensor kinase